MLAVGGVRQINLLRNSKKCLRKYFFLIFFLTTIGRAHYTYNIQLTKK